MSKLQECLVVSVKILGAIPDLEILDPKPKGNDCICYITAYRYTFHTSCITAIC